MRDPHWLLERDWLLSEYFPRRTSIVLNQFKSRGWYPNVEAPVFHINGSYRHGGLILANDVLSMTAPAGTIWYTLDGTDPRKSALPSNNHSSTTLVAENAFKRALVSTASIGDVWKSSLGFNDTSWMQSVGSPGGIGYERSTGYQRFISLDLEERMYARNTTCYIRIPFIFNGSSDEFNLLILNIRYDDGFVAYLNGTEVARRNFNSTPTWNSRASASHSDSVSTVFESIDVSPFLSNLQRGSNLLAVHGLNVSMTSSDFLISLELIAGKGDPTGPEGTSASAIRYTGPITLSRNSNVKARVVSNGTWSALNETIFAVGPVAENLRITEIMYHPQALTDATEPNEKFIELTNIGTETINLNLVRFTNGIDFTFPTDMPITIPDGGYLLIVKHPEAFIWRYPSIPTGQIFGPYDGKLSNAGESLEFSMPSDDSYIRIDRVNYSDGLHPENCPGSVDLWPTEADGTGLSLTRSIPADYGNDPDNWQVSVPSPGQ